jgi:hypothetical protein
MNITNRQSLAFVYVTNEKSDRKIKSAYLVVIWSSFRAKREENIISLIKFYFIKNKGLLEELNLESVI